MNIPLGTKLALSTVYKTVMLKCWPVSMTNLNTLYFLLQDFATSSLRCELDRDSEKQLLIFDPLKRYEIETRRKWEERLMTNHF